MRRAAAGVVVAALVAGLVLAPGLPGPGEGTARAAECTWKRHAQRVVKRVKRNGKIRRVARVKRWWSCAPLPSAPGAALPPSAVPAPSPAEPEPEPETGPARLSVKALEFSFTLSRPGVPAGEAIVELNNQGEDPHNLKLQLQGSDEELEVPEAGPLEHRSAKFELTAGSWRLWCSLPQHDEWGMNATLAVGSG